MRDIEDAFKDENGRLLLSKTAVSQLGERLWEDYQAVAECLRPGAKREPVLAAWGFTIEGRRVLLHLMERSNEDAETVTGFFEGMKRRGLKRYGKFYGGCGEITFGPTSQSASLVA